jgi:hypothetical protein
MENQLIKFKEMDLVETNFNGDPIMTVRMKDNNKIYVGVNWVCLGLGLSKGQMQNERLKIQQDLVLSKGERNLVLPTKGGKQQSLCIELNFLPLWLAKISITPNMKKNNPEIMEKLIDYQLNAKDVLAQAFLGKQKDWSLQREVGKIDRKRMTSSIQTYIPDVKFYTYANYTDMVYKILFDMTAKQIRESRNINKKSDLTRDYLTEDELKLVDEAETIVTALTALGFKYDYIKHQLTTKYKDIKLIK